MRPKRDCCSRWSKSTCATRMLTRPSGTLMPFNGLASTSCTFRGGPTNDFRSPFYYRIHGPRLIIEFAVQEPNHIHTIMRDPQNDYGMDWLGLHYEEHAWNAR